MKTNSKKYRIQVENSNGIAGLTCVINSNILSTKHFGAIFHEVITTFDNTSISIPTNRQATFQEELRYIQEAGAEEQETPNDIEKWIENKMKEAYGDNLIIHVEEIQA